MAFFKNLWTFLTETIFLKDERNYRNGLIRWGVRQYKLLFYTARGLDEHDQKQFVDAEIKEKVSISRTFSQG